MLTLDIGLAQLAMHSAYETAGAQDVVHMINASKAFYHTAIKAGEGSKYEIDMTL
jgi:aspartyl aminopeptidase